MEPRLRGCCGCLRGTPTLPEPANGFDQEPEPGNDHDQPGNDGRHGGNESGEAVAKDGAEIPQRFADGGEGAADNRPLFGVKGDFDVHLFGFVGEDLALRAFAVELRLSFREFLLDLQQVGHADAGLGQHPAQAVAKLSLVFEFGFDVHDRRSLVFRFRGVLYNFSLFPHEIKECIQVLRCHAGSDVTGGRQDGRFIGDARREHLALNGPAKRNHGVD